MARNARRIRSVITVALLGSLLLAPAACSSETTTWEHVQESGRLRVGLDPTFPPFEVLEGGKLQGLDVDLAEAIASDLELRTEYVHFGYDGLYDALQTGQVDVLISAMVVVPERLKDFSYSAGYFNAGQVLISEDVMPIRSEEQLIDRRLAVELGAEGHVLATAWQRRIPGLEIRPFSTPEDTLNAVVEGTSEAAVLDAVSALTLIGDFPRLGIFGEPVTDEPYAIVVRADDEILLEKLNESLRRIELSGRLDALITRWLGQKTGHSLRTG
jgi:ABC-type amino acid transport substrate-binding protein